jgi:predicted membrane protein
VVYLCFHFSNHLVALIGPEAHLTVMKALRVVYRSQIVEPLLALTFVFLIVSGACMAWKLTDRPASTLRTFQIAGGVFLIFAIASHMNAVLYLARVYFKIESDWGFAIGAPDGLIRNAWNIRLLPYYLLAVFFVISHAFCGLRGVMVAHSLGERLTTRVFVSGIVLAAFVAVTIILAMTGMRVSFA